MTPKKKRKLLIIAVAALVGIVGWLIFKPTKVDTGFFLERVRNKHKKTFDDINNGIQKENELIAQLDTSISKNDSTTALSLIDTLIVWGKDNTAYLYKGMLYEKQSEYSLAIEEYNKALALDKYSLGLSKRADLYMKINKPDLAVADYKKIFQWNYSYSFKIGCAFDAKKQKDSALKYYTIFLTHYPNNQSVIQKIKKLSK